MSAPGDRGSPKVNLDVTSALTVRTATVIRTLLHRAAVRTLDVVIDRGQTSKRAPVRAAAGALDRLRGVVGLDEIPARTPLPDLDGGHPDRPMWKSDQEKLRRYQIDHGIIKAEDDGDQAEAEAAAPKAAVTIYYRRGCPYSRAALDLLREREVDFNDVDMTDDQSLQAHVARLTGRKTSPQLVIHDEPIGGFDELRELVYANALEAMIAGDAVDDGDDAGEVDEVIDAAFLDEATEITTAEVRQRFDEGSPLLLLDVRREDEWRATGVIPGAVMITLSELEARASELDTKGLWIAYCRSGKRSLTARELLRANGIAGVLSMSGGILQWVAADGPTVPPEEAVRPKPKKRIKLAVLHPERSPFEELELGDVGDVGEERLEGKELVARVLEVLDEVRPMVQSDGGDIELLDVQGDIVSVKLTGNCIGCPSSQATLKQGIERRLLQRIPQLKGISSPQLQA